MINRIALAALALIATAAAARAEVYWSMDWTEVSPQRGCKPVLSDAVDRDADELRASGYASDVKEERFKDSGVGVVRVWVDWKRNGARNHFVYVADYGYCTAEFYDYRADEMRYRSGQQTVINAPR